MQKLHRLFRFKASNSIDTAVAYRFFIICRSPCFIQNYDWSSVFCNGGFIILYGYAITLKMFDFLPCGCKKRF